MNRPVLSMLVCVVWTLAVTLPRDAQASRPTQPTRAEVFVDASTTFALGMRGQHLLRTGRLDLYRMDAGAVLEQQLSRGLARDPRLALAQIRERIARMGERLKQVLQDSAQADLRARELGIQRVPAVVFDGEVVVYGASDLESAWSQWIKQTSARSGGTP